MIWAVTAIQIALAAAAAALLFVLWRHFFRTGIGTTIVAAGFLLRAAGGALVFWISYLGLPIAREEQLGEGLWSFGLDGQFYSTVADLRIGMGWSAVVFPDRTNPNHYFIETVAISRALFGPVVATAILVNLIAYLGAAILIAKWGSEPAGGRRAALVALAGLSFAPTQLLWATQPLKDALFVFLVVTFIYGFHRWLEAMKAWAWRGAALSGAMMCASVHVLGGIRWYYGCILWMLFLPIASWGALQMKAKRSEAMLLAIALFFAIAVMLMLALPLDFGRAARYMLEIPRALIGQLQGSHARFDEYVGSSTIEPGPVLRGVPFDEIFARGSVAALPRFVVAPLGLAVAGGDWGLWALAELDTLFFDVLIFAGIWLARSSRPLRIWRRPELLFLLLLFLASLPMVYPVNNFGSLIRFREMLLVPWFLLPLTLPRVEEDLGP